MKKVFGLFSTVILVLLLVSCTPTQVQYTMNTTQFITTVHDLANSYATVQGVILKNLTKFPAKDIKQLNKIGANLSSMAGIITQFDLTSQTVDVRFSTIQEMFSIAKKNYVLARKLIVKHWNEFPPDVQLKLSVFDTKAKHVEDTFESISSNKQMLANGKKLADTVQMSLELGKMLIPIIAKM